MMKVNSTLTALDLGSDELVINTYCIFDVKKSLSFADNRIDAKMTEMISEWLKSNSSLASFILCGKK